MLSKKYKVDRKSFTEIYKQGKTFFSQNIYLKTVYNCDKNTSFSFVVSGKVSKKATERNKLKRRARHITKNLLEKIRKGVCVAVFFKKEIISKKYPEIKEELESLYKKAKII